uniref:Uncharacterized protein n=1 Tax=Anopheles quadriannulatus TaxID=34691 RepID=A0A182XPT8_ANOQN
MGVSKKTQDQSGYDYAMAVMKMCDILHLRHRRKYAMLKLKIILSTILRNFRVYSDLKEEEFKLQADIILKREEGFQIRLEPRQRKSKTL